MDPTLLTLLLLSLRWDGMVNFENVIHAQYILTFVGSCGSVFLSSILQIRSGFLWIRIAITVIYT
jgi:hypothetical protein